KIPADTAFTFHTIDKNGMVLNAAQTWHQLRPGEVRNDCGGCHAHSQPPTPFNKTYAAMKDYQPWDLTKDTPLVTAQATVRKTGKAVYNVEYFRDVQPILEKSCTACHTKAWDEPAGNLVLDADDEQVQVAHKGKFPGSYYRLAMDSKARFGHKPVIHNGTWRQTNASRYIRKFQSRRSLLIWKIFGERLDGWSNHDFPSATVPGDAETLALNGEPIENTRKNRDRSDLDYNGKAMPPASAVEGTYKGPDGKPIRVEPLTHEDRLTLVRWIDLGCPIDLDHGAERGYGWLCDDNRPVLTMPLPRRGTNGKLSRILIGMYDYYSGLDSDTFHVSTSFDIDDIPAGRNLASEFRQTDDSVWSFNLEKPITELERGTVTVSIKDRQGNITRIHRTISVRADRELASIPPPESDRDR
ncbi:MAG: hypothetical protein AAF492_25320, partial [Verrucomicrobiota bacterium]